jgi:hypothetical protein
LPVFKKKACQKKKPRNKINTEKTMEGIIDLSIHVLRAGCSRIPGSGSAGSPRI